MRDSTCESANSANNRYSWTPLTTDPAAGFLSLSAFSPPRSTHSSASPRPTVAFIAVPFDRHNHNLRPEHSFKDLTTSPNAAFDWADITSSDLTASTSFSTLLIRLEPGFRIFPCQTNNWSVIVRIAVLSSLALFFWDHNVMKKLPSKARKPDPPLRRRGPEGAWERAGAFPGSRRRTATRRKKCSVVSRM